MNQNSYTNPNFNQNPNMNSEQNFQARPPVYPIRKTKNKFLTFVFSLMPGAGQMYQGLLKKGVSIMGLFFGVIATSIFLYIPVINFVLPIIWFYAFFDAINRINYTVDELKAMEDSYLVSFGIQPDGKITGIMKKRHIVFGWVLIIIAIYALLNVLFMNNYNFLDEVFGKVIARYISSIANIIPKLIIPVVCLLIGFKLIKGDSKKSFNQQNGGNDIEEKTN